MAKMKQRKRRSPDQPDPRRVQVEDAKRALRRAIRGEREIRALVRQLQRDRAKADVALEQLADDIRNRNADPEPQQ